MKKILVLTRDSKLLFIKSLRSTCLKKLLTVQLNAVLCNSTGDNLVKVRYKGYRPGGIAAMPEFNGQ